MVEDSLDVAEGLSLRVLRSSQTDAEQLDEELLSLFKGTLNSCLGRFHSDFLGIYYKELMVVLRSIIFGLTVGLGKPTPGMALLNVTYRNEYKSSKFKNNGPGLSKVQRTVLYVGNIIVPYLWSRLASHLARAMDTRGSFDSSASSIQRAFYTSSERIWNISRRIESIWMALELTNGVVYLKHGKYRRLLERLVGARLVYSHLGASRHISFDYLNRQLIWSEISDFILFFLPLVNVEAVKNVLHTYLPMNKALGGSHVHATCAICGAQKKSPVQCQVLPCQHKFCYYCIAGKMAQGNERRCYVCSEDISSIAMI